MSCVFDACRQGRESCTRSECGYLPLAASDEAADQPLTSFDYFAWALTVILAGVTLSFVALFFIANWDRISALMVGA